MNDPSDLSVGSPEDRAPRLTALRSALADVEAATRPSRELDEAIGHALGWTLHRCDYGSGRDYWTNANGETMPWPQTADLTATVTLVERELPECRIVLDKHGPNHWRAMVKRPRMYDTALRSIAMGVTASFALLTALIRALIAQEESRV